MEKKHHKVPFGPLGIIMAIGVVYGDIGTSPLYVMKSILSVLGIDGVANPNFILGAVSCVIWTLTLQTTVKYVLITLKADNNGEGGILSLFALIREHYRWAYVIAAIGAATLLADGVVTPAITVISAIEGLNVIMPSIPVIPVTIGIIMGIFVVQSFGTSSLGRFFGTAMLFWFLMLGVLGLHQFVYMPSVIKAFNPWYAIQFLREAPNTLFILGAVFLCTTGAEALYSDLGHCGLKNIRVSWTFVKVTLILNYLGQAAWILNNKEHVVAGMSLADGLNPFFEIMPDWFRIIGIIMATIAAIIASQALISGSFTIISEAISLNIWPNVKIKYPTKIKGQMYIPSVNYALMVICIIMVLAFQKSSNLEAAYGLSITLSMLMTTMLLFVYFLKNKKPLWFSIPLTLFFLSVELSFFTANMQKFAHGGFASILIACIIFFLMYSWYNGRRIKRHHTNYDQVDEKYISTLQAVSEDESIPKTATHLVYITRANNKYALESKIGYSLFKRRPKRADTYWFMCIRRSDNPYDFHYSVKTYIPQKAFRIDIKIGFKIGMHTDKYVKLISNDMERQGLVDLSSRYPSMEKSKARGEFTYVVVDRVFRNMEANLWRRGVLYCYKFIKMLATSDTQMLDIDPSLAIVEKVPLIQADYSEEELKELLHQSKLQSVD